MAFRVLTAAAPISALICGKTRPLRHSVLLPCQANKKQTEGDKTHQMQKDAAVLFFGFFFFLKKEEENKEPLLPVIKQQFVLICPYCQSTNVQRLFSSTLQISEMSSRTGQTTPCEAC